MARLDTDRQNKLEPKRIEVAIRALDAVGINPIIVSGKRIEFEFKGGSVFFYPYSGWHTGKSIKDGRGLQNLLTQLKTTNQ